MRIVTSVFLAAFATASVAQTALPIPSDAKAKYFVLERGGSKGMPTLTTKRVGSSGTSYSQRVFDCSTSQVKYLGTGDSLEEMKNSKPDPNMGPLIKGSISWYQWQHACVK